MDRLLYPVTDWKCFPFDAHKLELNITVLSFSQLLEFQCPAQYSCCWGSWPAERYRISCLRHLSDSPHRCDRVAIVCSALSINIELRYPTRVTDSRKIWSISPFGSAARLFFLWVDGKVFLPRMKYAPARQACQAGLTEVPWGKRQAWLIRYGGWGSRRPLASSQRQLSSICVETLQSRVMIILLFWVKLEDILLFEASWIFSDEWLLGSIRSW